MDMLHPSFPLQKVEWGWVLWIGKVTKIHVPRNWCMGKINTEVQRSPLETSTKPILNHGDTMVKFSQWSSNILENYCRHNCFLLLLLFSSKLLCRVFFHCCYLTCFLQRWPWSCRIFYKKHPHFVLYFQNHFLEKLTFFWSFDNSGCMCWNSCSSCFWINNKPSFSSLILVRSIITTSSLSPSSPWRCS